MSGFNNTLIVDDEPINTFVVNAFLENLGQKSLTFKMVWMHYNY